MVSQKHRVHVVPVHFYERLQLISEQGQTNIELKTYNENLLLKIIGSINIDKNESKLFVPMCVNSYHWTLRKVLKNLEILVKNVRCKILDFRANMVENAYFGVALFGVTTFT